MKRGGKKLFDLVLHTPPGYKRLGYTTLAPNNQSGQGSQRRPPCTLSLTTDLPSRATQAADGWRGQTDVRKAGAIFIPHLLKLSEGYVAILYQMKVGRTVL